MYVEALTWLAFDRMEQVICVLILYDMGQKLGFEIHNKETSISFPLTSVYEGTSRDDILISFVYFYVTYDWSRAVRFASLDNVRS